MGISTDAALDVLRTYGISPEATQEVPQEVVDDGDHPEVGTVAENEQIYSTSITEVFRTPAHPDEDSFVNDPRLAPWFGSLREIVETSNSKLRPLQQETTSSSPEPACAWYCPVHFYGHGWGIYIRENCIMDLGLAVARFVDWSRVGVSTPEAARQLLRTGFYILFLHEQFHHKVESLGFRLLIARQNDCYVRYKRNVYRPTLRTKDCLEEALANADSFLRLSESRYVKKLDPEILVGVKDYLPIAFTQQPLGYAEAVQYLTRPRYDSALKSLHSQILEGTSTPKMASNDWAVAPNMIKALKNISSAIYVILPAGARPIFRPTDIDPGWTVTSQELEKALVTHHGYSRRPGGKGSHVKLAKPGAETITIPGNRSAVSPGVVKQVLRAVGGYPLSRIPDLLRGDLR